jgi:hypothetical protein
VTLTLIPAEDPEEPSAAEQRIIDALRAGGAFFAGQLAAMTQATSEQAVVDTLWNLAWTGRVTNDTFAPVRGLLAGGSQAHRTTRRAPRARMFRGTSIPTTLTAARPPHRARRWPGTLVAAARAVRRWRTARDGLGEPSPGALRRRHARQCAGRGRPGRVRAGVPCARRIRGCRALSPRLLHREARGRTVRGIRHRRPPPRVRRLADPPRVVP